MTVDLLLPIARPVVGFEDGLRGTALGHHREDIGLSVIDRGIAIRQLQGLGTPRRMASKGVGLGNIVIQTVRVEGLTIAFKLAFSAFLSAVAATFASHGHAIDERHHPPLLARAEDDAHLDRWIDLEA